MVTKSTPHVWRNTGREGWDIDRCESDRSASKLRAGAAQNNRGGQAMSYSYKKLCRFCGSEFFSQYRAKACCSFTCTKRHEASLQRVRGKRRRAKTVTHDLDANTETRMLKSETPA